MAILEFDENEQKAKIKVIGVGGGGGNAINTMIASNLDGVEFIAANTDVQALQSNLASAKIQLGATLTKGLGAGAKPEVGRNAALEDISRLAESLSSADMVFVTAGMGGGTGTGAAPVIAQVARECGALTVGVVTKPFHFEGKKRRRQAEEGLQALQNSVDTLITIPNQRLLAVASNATSMIDAFRKVDEVLLNAVQGISDLITVPGLINVDFADVKTIMSNMGMALMGTGRAAGDHRALQAAQQAVASPLLEDVSIDGATGILINITGGPNLTLHEVNEAACLIQEAAHEDANIIFGSVIDSNMGDEVKITVIATGFDRMADADLRDPNKPSTHRTSVSVPANYSVTPTPFAPAPSSFASAPAAFVTAPVMVAPAPAPLLQQAVQPPAALAPLSFPTTTPVPAPAPRAPARLTGPGMDSRASDSRSGDASVEPVAAPPADGAPVRRRSQGVLPFGAREERPDLTPPYGTQIPGRAATGSVPRLHPGHPGLPTEEHEIDIPTFLRRNPHLE